VKVEVARSIDLRYTGQSSELTIPVPWQRLSEEKVPDLARMFHEEHQKSYAHMRPEEGIDIVNLRVAARVRGAEDKLHADGRRAEAGPVVPRRRRAYFGRTHGWRETPVLGIGEITAAPVPGPLIVELYDSTCVVPPGCTVSAGMFGSMTIDVIG
jgi:N-methylhydantoinase A